jgi:hypothetical protein
VSGTGHTIHVPKYDSKMQQMLTCCISWQGCSALPIQKQASSLPAHVAFCFLPTLCVLAWGLADTVRQAINYSSSGLSNTVQHQIRLLAYNDKHIHWHVEVNKSPQEGLNQQQADTLAHLLMVLHVGLHVGVLHTGGGRVCSSRERGGVGGTHAGRL